MQELRAIPSILQRSQVLPGTHIDDPHFNGRTHLIPNALTSQHRLLLHRLTLFYYWNLIWNEMKKWQSVEVQLNGFLANRSLKYSKSVLATTPLLSHGRSLGMFVELTMQVVISLRRSFHLRIRSPFNRNDNPCTSTSSPACILCFSIGKITFYF